MSKSRIDDLEKSIKRRFKYHLRAIGYQRNGNTIVLPSEEKTLLRSIQSKRRAERLRDEKKFIKSCYPEMRNYFASGSELVPDDIRPHLEVVKSGTEFSDLFRLASLTWGVPVSNGYGRRLRFLVFDKNNNKIMGLIGLADPVFNLGARDDAIGWSSQDRKDRLVDILNAYILGALPPYNMLLGGKLISTIVRTREVKENFYKRYNESKGIISGVAKKPSLVMVTTTSSLGKSTIYDRLKLKHGESKTVEYFTSVGFTLGWGHFHVPNSLFRDMRLYLELKENKYANGYKYGNGSNWRWRASKAALKLLGLNGELMNHGVKREVFLCRLASNADEVLRGDKKRPVYSDLLSVSQVSRLAIDRWVIKRSERRKEYLLWKSENILDLLNPKLTGQSSLLNLANPVQLGSPFENNKVSLSKLDTQFSPTIKISEFKPNDLIGINQNNVHNNVEK